MSLKKSHGGIQKKSHGMGKEVGHHKAAGYPKSGKGGSSLYAHALEAKHSSHNSNADGGDALGPVKSVDDYHPQG